MACGALLLAACEIPVGDTPAPGEICETAIELSEDRTAMLSDEEGRGYWMVRLSVAHAGRYRIEYQSFYGGITVSCVSRSCGLPDCVSGLGEVGLTPLEHWIPEGDFFLTVEGYGNGELRLTAVPDGLRSSLRCTGDAWCNEAQVCVASTGTCASACIGVGEPCGSDPRTRCELSYPSVIAHCAGECDPVTQSDCGALTCAPRLTYGDGVVTSADQLELSTECVDALHENNPAGAYCEDDFSCERGYGCVGYLADGTVVDGRCARYCLTDFDCPSDQSCVDSARIIAWSAPELVVARTGWHELGFCLASF